MSIGAPTFAGMTLEAFTTSLASGQPVPGGGSAACVAAALGASLSSMVVRLSLGRPAFEAHAALLADVLAASDAARARFLSLADEDATAYAGYREARRLPHTTDEEDSAREAATRRAARASTAVPLAVVQACARQAAHVERLAGRTNPHAASDLLCAVLLLEAAARAAGENVLVNVPSVADEAFAAQARVDLAADLERLAAAAERTREVVASAASRAVERP